MWRAKRPEHFASGRGVLSCAQGAAQGVRRQNGVRQSGGRNVTDHIMYAFAGRAGLLSGNGHARGINDAHFSKGHGQAHGKAELLHLAQLGRGRIFKKQLHNGAESHHTAVGGRTIPQGP